MIPFNYHHLYYFWTVAKSGSIAAATQRLYLSQPTLSGQLKELEHAFGVKLLDRGRKGVSLTHEGNLVFEYCERIFGEGELLAALVKNGFSATPNLRLGVQPSVSRDVALRLLAYAREAAPSCRATIFSGELDVLVAKLRRRAIDLIIANEDCSAELGKDYLGRLVGQLPVYFVASPAVKRLIKRFPADLTKTALLLRPAENPVRKQVEEYLRRRRIAFGVEADSDDVELLRRLALEGRGVAALSGMAVARDLKSGHLAMLHRSPVGIHEQIWFVCGTRLRSDPALQHMMDALMRDFTIFGRAPSVKSLLNK